MNKIAVLIGGLIYDSQKKILEGIYSVMDAAGVQVYTFTCYILHSNGEKLLNGAHEIYGLPDLKGFDGIIVAPNTIAVEEARDAVFAAIRQSGVPAVCLDGQKNGMASVMVDNYYGMYDLVEHLMSVHGARNIWYLSGPGRNRDVCQRKKAFLDVLKRYGIDSGDTCVFEGDFASESGRAAWDHWMEESNGLPDAIVCANDAMAQGVLVEMALRGVDVPGQVMVTGVDNSQIAHSCQPALTTIDRDYYQMGRAACDLLLMAVRGVDIRDFERHFPSKVVIGESCGCSMETAQDMRAFKHEQMISNYNIQEIASVIRCMTNDFSGIGSFQELLEALKIYVAKTDAQYFYLCMSNLEQVFAGASEEDVSDDSKKYHLCGYTDYITVPLAYEDGEFTSYGAFPKGEVLPRWRKCKDSGPIHYVFLPLHYQDESFGYCVFGNSDFPKDKALCYNWIQTICGAIQNVRKNNYLHEIIRRLNETWGYDALTKVYNRAGFFQKSEELLKRAQRERRGVYILFLDIDGLKTVNDTYGHKAGDQYITGVAEILKQAVEPDELLMRYGGDEFVVMGMLLEYDRADELIREIESSLILANRSGEYKYLLSASMGYESLSADSEIMLERILDQADQKMYHQKRRRRESREN